MLRVQIAVAEKSINQRRPSSVDIYMRKVEDVKQHYEEQLLELREEFCAEQSNITFTPGRWRSPADRTYPD